MRLTKMRWAAALFLISSVLCGCSAGGSAQSQPGQTNATGGVGGTTSYATGGSTAANGGGTAQATGGTPAGHDPTLFNWPEANSDGSAALRCQAGHYVGTYNCDVQGNGLGEGGVAYPLTGPVDLRLAESQNGEFLTVSGGALTSAAGALQLTATVTGTLNCQTGAFSGTLQDGGLALWPFPVDPNTVGGTLSAVFDENGPKLNGSWTLVGQKQFVGYSCSGPWSATWQAN